MMLLGTNSGNGTIKAYLPIKGEIANNRINGSTLHTYASGTGFNGQVIQDLGDGTYNLVVTNVEAYATIDMFASNCELLASWFAG